MISNAGRTVCAVVCRAPDTMPSTMSLCTSMVPKYETSWMISRACSTVTPLCFRSSAYWSANLSHSSLVCGSSTSAADRSTPSSAARARTCASSPRIVSSATPRCRSRPAAVRMRSSSPSGSTMCLRSDAGPVQQLVGEHLRRHHRRNGNGQLRQQIRGVDVGVHQRQRGVDLAQRGRGDPPARRRHPARGLERAEPRRDDRQPQTQAGHQRRDRRMQLKATVEDHARQRRKALRPHGHSRP